MPRGPKHYIGKFSEGGIILRDLDFSRQGRSMLIHRMLRPTNLEAVNLRAGFYASLPFFIRDKVRPCHSRDPINFRAAVTTVFSNCHPVGGKRYQRLPRFVRRLLRSVDILCNRRPSPSDGPRGPASRCPGCRCQGCARPQVDLAAPCARAWAAARPGHTRPPPA